MHRTMTLAIITSAFGLLLYITPVLAEKRVALVIGNANYKYTEQLASPRADAEAVAAALRDIGFQIVRLEHDLTRTEFIQSLRAFAADASNADWAVFYFAGHGVGIDGLNYLIPIDAQLDVNRDVRLDAVSLDMVLAVVEDAKKLRLVLLDASRDLRKFVRACVRCPSPRGLSRVEPERGTLVGFSARDGELAREGDGKNSPYVSALLDHIKTPGLEIRKLFDKVGEDVLAATAKRQMPFIYGSAAPREDFFFVPPK